MHLKNLNKKNFKPNLWEVSCKLLKLWEEERLEMGSILFAGIQVRVPLKQEDDLQCYSWWAWTKGTGTELKARPLTCCHILAQQIRVWGRVQRDYQNYRSAPATIFFLSFWSPSQSNNYLGSKIVFHPRIVFFWAAQIPVFLQKKYSKDACTGSTYNIQNTYDRYCLWRQCGREEKNDCIFHYLLRSIHPPPQVN